MMFTLLAVIVSLVPFCCGLTALEEIKQCIEQRTLNNPSGNNYIEKHCNHIRSLAACYSQKPSVESSDSKAVIEDLRFIMEQEARFQEKYNVCDPKIDYSKLTELLEKSAGTKKKYSSYILDNDYPEPCALEPYEKCLKKYRYDVFHGHQVCADFSVFIVCLIKEAQTTTCEAKILQDLASIYKTFGLDVIMKMREYMPKECNPA